MPVPESAPSRSTRCPCLSGESYDTCCERLHRGVTTAATAEILMRARYAAFAVGDPGYLLRTWHASTRPETLELDPEQHWVRLDVERLVRGGPLDTVGVVEFTAHFRQHGKRHQQHETSRFVREQRTWFYVDELD